MQRPLRPFVSLHGHSDQSWLDGYGTAKQIAKRVASLGQTAAAVTDHGNVVAHVSYQKEFRKLGIKPIFGCEFYVVEDASERSKYNPSLGVEGFPHATVIAMNQRGYENLLKLNNYAWREGFYYKPRVDWQTIARHQEGLLVLSGCVGGWPSRLVNNTSVEDAWRFVQERRAQIEHYYVELVPVPTLDISRYSLPFLTAIAADLGVPCVLTSDAHFPSPEDYEAQDLMCCVGQGKKLSDTNRFVRLEPYMYYCTRDELVQRGLACIQTMDDRWPAEIERAADNSAILAEMCNVEIPRAKPVSYPGVTDSAGELWRWIAKGVEERRAAGQIPPELEKDYYDRVVHEYHVICGKGFADYILAVTDICRWAKKQGSIVMCRGSAGGCLMLWVLGCSETDSIRHELSFERFYDENRPDPPDIDVDFEQGTRPKVIEYIYDKYGRDKCSQIIALGLLRARNAVIDAAKAYDIPRHEITPLVSMLDSKDDDLDLQLENLTDGAARAVLEKYPQLHIASKMIGQCRQMGIHACGMIISAEPLEKVIGVMEQPGKPPVSSCDKHAAAELGFLKMDFLSVNAYDIVGEALRLAGLTPEWLYSLPLGDARDIEAGVTWHHDVYEMAKQLQVAGVFQLDGAAIGVAQKIGLDRFEELYACSALCRPGAANFVELYRSNKHNRAEFEAYLSRWHPIAVNIIRQTYGVLLYQEQVMRMLREMAGFDWKYVHSLRKRIANASFHGKPLEHEHEVAFVEGCVKNGISAEEAAHWWDAIKQHGIYSFNKSHCVTYGVVGYWMLALKRHYPQAYYEAFLRYEGSKQSPDMPLMKRLISEFVELGGRVVLLDPRMSKETFRIVDGVLYGGYRNIKGIGQKLADAVASKGPFDGWEGLGEAMIASRGQRVFAELCEAMVPLGPGSYATDKVILLAPWFPTVATLPHHAEFRKRAFHCLRPGWLDDIKQQKRDAYVIGYVTTRQKLPKTGSFKGDQILYVIEDETGKVLARVSNKNLDTVGAALEKAISLGDYVILCGWWSGEGTLFVREWYNYTRSGGAN